MFGKAPRLNPNCTVFDYSNDVLVFSLLAATEEQGAEQEDARQQQAEYLEFARQRNFCLGELSTPGSEGDQIDSCNSALTFTRHNQVDYADLLQRRDRLVFARDQLLSSRQQEVQAERERRELIARMDAREEEIRRNGIAEREAAAQLARERATYAVRTIPLPDLAVAAPDWIARISSFTRIILFFSVAALTALFGMYFIAKRTCLPDSVITSVLALTGGSIIVAVMFSFSLRYAMSTDFYWVVTLLGQGGSLSAGVLAFIALGASEHSRFRKQKPQLPHVTMISVSVLTVLACMAALIGHARSVPHLDDSLFIVVMFSWVFVLGFVLVDPYIQPLLPRVEQFLWSPGSGIKRAVYSFCATTYKALQSVYESLHGQREASATRNLPAVVEASQPLDIPYASSGQRMQLKLKRSQRSGLTGNVTFVVDARMEIPAEEYSLIQRYKLGNLVIYDSSARKEHTEAMKAHLESTRQQASYRDSAGKQFWGVGKTLYRFARAGVSATMASLSLRITVYSLMRGVHVECKSMKELLEAEKAIVEAGENLRTYLDTAATFDGREEVHEF